LASHEPQKQPPVAVAISAVHPADAIEALTVLLHE